MENQECSINQFMKNRIWIDMADFIAIEIEHEDSYFIVKCRYGYGVDGINNNGIIRFPQFGTILDEQGFNEINKQSSRQIILSDRYIDIDKTIEERR